MNKTPLILTFLLLFLISGVVGCGDPHTESVNASTAAAKNDITYDTSSFLADASQPTAGVAFGDINHDGYLDIVLAKGRHWTAKDEVIFGDGQGSTLSKYTLPHAADRSYGGPIADLDLDGDLDIVIGNDAPDDILTYMNNGSGEFSDVRTFGNPNWPTRYCNVADLNSDSAPDVMIANRSSAGAVVCSNTKVNNSYGNFPTGSCQKISSVPCTSIAVGDFNGDSLPDLVVPHRNGGQSYLYWGPDFDSNSRVSWGPANGKIRIAQVADLNSDGNQDIVTISQEAGGFNIYYGIGNGKFQSTVVSGMPSSVPYALNVGDLNLDGRPDIVVGYVKARPVVLFRQPSSDPTVWKMINFGDKQGTVYSIAFGDYNMDGHSDIALGRSDAESRVYFASSNGAGPGTQYNLAVNTSGKGSVALNPAGGTYDQGTTVTLTATPASGWEFANWNGDLSGTSQTNTITMNANKSVDAIFTEQNTPPSDSCEGLCGGPALHCYCDDACYYYNDCCPDMQQWCDGPVSQYDLTVNTSGQGSVSLNPKGPTYDEGTTVTLQATPDSGWEFTNWNGDLSGTSQTKTITMNTNKSVTAIFTKQNTPPGDSCKGLCGKKAESCYCDHACDYFGDCCPDKHSWCN